MSSDWFSSSDLSSLCCWSTAPVAPSPKSQSHQWGHELWSLSSPRRPPFSQSWKHTRAQSQAEAELLPWQNASTMVLCRWVFFLQPLTVCAETEGKDLPVSWRARAAASVESLWRWRPVCRIELLPCKGQKVSTVSTHLLFFCRGIMQ